MIYPNVSSIANPLANSTFTVRDGYVSAINDPSLLYSFDQMGAPQTLSSSLLSLAPHTSNLATTNTVLTRNIPTSGNNPLTTFIVNSATSSNNVRNLIMERLQEIVSSEAQRIVSKFPNENNADNLSPKVKTNVMFKMKKLAKQFSSKNKNYGLETLKELKKLLLEHEISVFHFTHSGIDIALTTYLTDESKEFQPSRILRLKQFVDVFMSINVSVLNFLYTFFL